jgi:hypothetical protein
MTTRVDVIPETLLKPPRLFDVIPGFSMSSPRKRGSQNDDTIARFPLARE